MLYTISVHWMSQRNVVFTIFEILFYFFGRLDMPIGLLVYLRSTCKLCCSKPQTTTITTEIFCDCTLSSVGNNQCAIESVDKSGTELRI